MSRKDRRAQAKVAKKNPIPAPKRANRKVLTIIAVLTVLFVLGTYAVFYSGSL
jgi:hypothetical protein